VDLEEHFGERRIGGMDRQQAMVEKHADPVHPLNARSRILSQNYRRGMPTLHACGNPPYNRLRIFSALTVAAQHHRHPGSIRYDSVPFGRIQIDHYSGNWRLGGVQAHSNTANISTSDGKSP